MPMRGLQQFLGLLLFISVAVSTSAQTSKYAEKFKAIDVLEIGYHKVADDFIDDYIGSRAETAKALGRYMYYKPMIDSIFASYKIPKEGGLLVLAASGADVFYDDEKSGNKGAWAMQYSVARMYGVKVNTYVDERRNIEKTTRISAKFLKELYLIYNSWSMAFAAYATTTLTINKNIRLAGNSFNYWEMYDSLPLPAQNIVPAYIAASFIYNYHNDYGITPTPFKEIPYDTFRLKKWMSFEAMAPTLHTTVDVLQSLNPIFKKGIVPLSVTPYVLKLPKQSKPWFTDIDTVDFKPYNTNPFVDETVLNLNNLDKPKAGGKTYTGSDTIYHVVKRGEGLGIIAQKYGVTVDSIKSWNNIRGYMIHPNQRIMIIRKE